MDIRDETLLVDGFEIRWEPGHDNLRVTVRRAGPNASGSDAVVKIIGPPATWPSRETMEMMAMNLWHAQERLSSIADRETHGGLPGAS
jgi:hypothetical protein